MDWEEILRQLQQNGMTAVPPGVSVAPGGVAPMPVNPANVRPMPGAPLAPNPYNVPVPDTGMQAQVEMLRSMVPGLQAERNNVPPVTVTPPNPFASSTLPPDDSPLGRARQDMIAAASGPTEAQLQAATSGASGASANAILNAYKNSGYGAPNAQDYLWKNIEQAPYPTQNMPAIPQRVAPKFDPLSRALGAIAGMFVPRAAGELNAAPIQGALDVAQMQTGDKQKAYEQAMQQAAIQQANTVAGRQDAFRNAVLQQEETLKGNEALTGAERTAGQTLSPSEGTAAGSVFLSNALVGPNGQGGPGTISGQESAANLAKAASVSDIAISSAAQDAFKNNMGIEEMRMKFGDQLATIIERGINSAATISQKLYWDGLRASMANQRNTAYQQGVDQTGAYHTGILANQGVANTIRQQNADSLADSRYGNLDIANEKMDSAIYDAKLANDPQYKLLSSGYESAMKLHNQLITEHSAILGKPNVNPYQLQQNVQMIQKNDSDLERFNAQLQGYKAARSHPAPDSASHQPTPPGTGKYKLVTPGAPAPTGPGGAVYNLPGQ